jgi:hypothetical protein
MTEQQVEATSIRIFEYTLANDPKWKHWHITKYYNTVEDQYLKGDLAISDIHSNVTVNVDVKGIHPYYKDRPCLSLEYINSQYTDTDRRNSWLFRENSSIHVVAWVNNGTNRVLFTNKEDLQQYFHEHFTSEEALFHVKVNGKPNGTLCMMVPFETYIAWANKNNILYYYSDTGEIS